MACAVEGSSGQTSLNGPKSDSSKNDEVSINFNLVYGYFDIIQLLTINEKSNLFIMEIKYTIEKINN